MKEKNNFVDIPSIAHRGYSKYEIENTVSSFIEAGKRNFIGIETDIYFTKDEIIICHHDPIVKGMDKNISESLFEEIKKINLGDKKVAYVPTFKEYLSIIKHYKKIPVIELKTGLNDAELDKVIRTIKEEDIGINKCFFISFHRQVLKRLQSISKQNGYSYKIFRLGTTLLDALEALEDRMNLDFEYSKLNEEIIEMFKKKSLLVAIWTINDISLVDRYKKLGVNFITSNYIESNEKTLTKQSFKETSPYIDRSID